MICIGYLPAPEQDPSSGAQQLEALGCQAVRIETLSQPDGGKPVLEAVLSFLGPGDQLVVLRLHHLASSSRELLDVLGKLRARGASLRAVEPSISQNDAAPSVLHDVLQAALALDPPAFPLPPAATRADQIQALHKAGFGPVEIAQRLGVSRMTVWRQLRGRRPDRS